MQISLNLLISLILTFPHGVGFLIYSNDFGIDKLLTIFILPFLIKIIKINNKTFFILCLLLISFSFFQGINSWIAGIFSKQSLFFFYDILFALTFFYSGTYISRNKEILIKTLNQIILFSIFFNIIALLLNIFNVDLSLIRPGEQYSIYLTRGDLGEGALKHYMGFYAASHEASFWFLFYKLIYILRNALKSKYATNLSFLGNNNFFLIYQLFFSLLIIFTQTRFLTIITLILDIFILINYIRKKNQAILLFIIIIILIPIFIYLVKSSFYYKYLLENVNTLIRFNDLNYDNPYKFNFLADKRIIGYTYLLTNNPIDTLINFGIKPLGPLFYIFKNSTLSITGLDYNIWDDLSAYIVYFFAYGFSFFIGFLSIATKVIFSKNKLPKIVPFLIFFSSLQFLTNNGLYILTFISAIYINYNDKEIL
tara:strand:+ start:352 stop:1623 length:1272 start_codon:yes stop_codon:yes gene_type:complete